MVSGCAGRSHQPGEAIDHLAGVISDHPDVDRRGMLTRRLTPPPVPLAVIWGQKTNSPKVRQSFPGRASYLPKMPEPKVYEFSEHICALCATRGTDVFRLGAKLGIDPMELLQMINGKVGADQGSHQRSGEGTPQQADLSECHGGVAAYVCIRTLGEGSAEGRDR